MKQNGTLSYRVEQLEKSYDELDNKIDKILTNHLPHIDQAIAALKTEVRILAVINIGALILFKILS